MAGDPFTFRPSYQGWKQHQGPEGSYRCPAFRPSYQGWKLIGKEVTKDGRGPFRPSYQGWKLQDRIGPPPPVLLLDLPIRDGNGGDRRYSFSAG